MSSTVYFINNRKTFLYKSIVYRKHDDLIEILDWCDKKFLWNDFYWDYKGNEKRGTRFYFTKKEDFALFYLCCL